ncbi:MAG: hypothetical protein WBA88_18370 [Pseudaminobacter sp.]
MKIVVIGATARIRSETAEKLRERGHEVAQATSRHQASILTQAPRDPGHAGRHLRKFLERTFALMRTLWCRLRRQEAGDVRGRGQVKPRREDSASWSAVQTGHREIETGDWT